MAPNQAMAGLFGLFSGNQHNALFDAIDVGNKNYAENLILQGAKVNAADGAGQTALMKTAMRGNDEVANMLIKYGADVNMQDRLGNTALHYAASADHVQIAEVLVKNGANVHVANKAGQTAFEEAVLKKSVNVAKVIDPSKILAVESQTAFPIAAVAAGGGISGQTVAVGAGVAAAGAGAAVAAGGGGGGGGGGSSGGSSGSDSGGGDSGDGNSGDGNSGGSNPPVDDGSSANGGNAAGSSNNVPLVIPDNTINNGSAVSFETPEYTAQYGLGNIHASSAYSRGYTGNNVLVAVVDSGVDLDHPDLIANIAPNAATCLSGAPCSTTVANAGNDDGNQLTIDNGHVVSFGHGTHVAGIIAATKNDSNPGMHGIAYNAKILPVKVMYSNGDGFSNDVTNGINYAVNNGAKVINLSLGGVYQGSPNTPAFADIKNAIANALNSNVLVVAATGNSGSSNPAWPARYAGHVAINPINTPSADYGALLAVGAVYSNNQITSYSNRCGDAMQWCLVAPGDNIYSTNNDGSYVNLSGTSMADPHVSAAAAVLISAFPNLTRREVALILLNTADDLGVSGVDSVYGHGLLNLEAATRPLGTIIVPLGLNINSNQSSFVSSNLTLNSAFGNSIDNSNQSFAILDSYNRAYSVDVASVTQQNTNQHKFFDQLTNFAEPLSSKLQNTALSDNLSFGFTAIDHDDNAITEPGIKNNITNYFSLNSEFENYSQSFNYNMNLASDFGFAATPVLNNAEFLSDTARGNPYLALSSGGGYNAISSFKVPNTNAIVKFAAFSGENTSDHKQENFYQNNGMIAEIALNFKDLQLSTQFGLLNESDSFLGSKTSGAFAVGDNNVTSFYNLAADYNLSNNIGLFAVYNLGVTKTNLTENSLISDISEITSQNYMLGAFMDDNFTEGDRFGLAYSVPLHVTSGDMQLNLPYAVDTSGNLYHSQQNISLSPENIEQDVELFYSMPVSDSSKYSFGLMHRENPGNTDQDADEVFMFKYTGRF